MRVFADYHHHDLFESMRLLFAERFGWELYRPIGMDWFHEGYWNFERAWHGDAVAKQYLTPWGDDEERDGVSHRWDPSHKVWMPMLTLEQAREIKPDIVIASVAHNHEGFHRFAKEVGAKFGLQIGNIRATPYAMTEDRWDLADFGLVTTTLPVAPPKPHVIYHQEFSLEDFRYEPPPRGGKFRVSSFTQCFAENPPGYAQFTDLAASMDEFDWRVYGSYGSKPEDQWAAGNIGVCSDVAAAMRASDVGWHTKQWSDGYGHVIHNLFAVGRPVFGHYDYYRTQLAGPLWVEGVTSIDVGSKRSDEIQHWLRRLAADRDLHLRISEAAADRFRALVNFDEEALRIADMFSAVL